MKARVESLMKLKKERDRKTAEMEATKTWPSDTKSLVGVSWIGLCPIDFTHMVANLTDYYECPKCRLQICVDADGPSIMPLKGMGNFRMRGDTRIFAMDELPPYGVWRIKYDKRVEAE